MQNVNTTIINRFGRITGWSRVTFNLYGRDVEGIMELSYDDNVDKDNEYGAGRYPLGQSEGNYEAKISISLYSEEVIAIQKSIPKGRRIQDIPATDVFAEYEYNGFVIKDAIRGFSIKTNIRDIKQGDKKISVKLEGICSHVDWDI